MKYLRRSARTKLYKAILILLALVFVIDLRTLSSTGELRVKRAPAKTVYISSIFWNSAAILQSSWNKAIVQLAEELGPKHVFLSIYESGSWDSSKEQLRHLEQTLKDRGIAHRIILDQTTHENEINREPETKDWIKTPRGKTELRRVPYLSKLRNKSLEPLAELAANGTRFNQVLFLNDVAFSTEDVYTLLNTNNGDYAAACALDFSRPPNFYDTFALRDIEGHEPLMMTFPYFRSTASRAAIKANRAVPVKSCWNGMVAFDARAFYRQTPLSFRGIPDSLAKHHLEGSECCLIHADNPLSATNGVWLNPSVRVGYSQAAYDAVHASEPYPSLISRSIGIWANRFRRWTTTVWFKERRVRGRIRKWEREDTSSNREPGPECLINEMQVLVHNGWAHV